MKKNSFILYINVLILIGLNSCKVINSNALFQIPKDESFEFDSIPLIPDENYNLSPGDRFSFIFSTNDGERIILGQSGIDIEGLISNQSIINQNRYNIEYLVRQNGIAELPIVGEIKVEGMTIVELEDTLESILSKTYINPYVQINISNQRVIVFPGRGKAQVVYLKNTNTSLLEAIALAGGVSNEAKAYSIKVMRKIEGKDKREIYKVDLSTINGLREAEMLVQSNDYIYIDYKPRYASETLVEIGPWLSLVTTTLAVIAIFR